MCQRDDRRVHLSDPLVARTGQALHASLFFLGAQPLLHSLAGGIGESLGGGVRQLIGVFVGRVTEEAKLGSKPATPFAEPQMNPQAEALENWQFVIQRLGLKTAGLPAAG